LNVTRLPVKRVATFVMSSWDAADAASLVALFLMGADDGDSAMSPNRIVVMRRMIVVATKNGRGPREPGRRTAAGCGALAGRVSAGGAGRGAGVATGGRCVAGAAFCGAADGRGAGGVVGEGWDVCGAAAGGGVLLGGAAGGGAAGGGELCGGALGGGELGAGGACVC